ncbi:hypothetical protein [Mycobacterium sp.]|uniref:hypothetical protein n=1 Tax=Mycobacterium sp. TaxID=1785 RepID=UPI0025CDF0B4|nr:hypothetical protein [Mycobacterium sp.]
MAEKRPPGFNVDLDFYDSPEVMSIPRKIRAAAIGVWTLAGSYSAKKLTDGYVPADKLRELGCTPTVRAALMATRPEPLWVDGDHVGDIRFTRWTKWQRTSGEVKAYREAEAERKRKAREAAKGWPSSGDSELSGRTNGGRAADVRTDVGDPRGRAPARQTETKTKTKNSGYVHESATDSTGRGAVAATPAADLVRKIVPSEINSATQTELRIRTGALLNDGTPPDVVEEALRDWVGRTGVGPGVLASMAADVVKRRDGHARAAPNGPPSKLRGLAELAAEERVREQAQLETISARKELG